MPNHPGHPALASSQELITGPGRISSALDAISVQTVTSSGYIRPRDGRYIIVKPSESITLTLPDPDSDPAFQNIRIVLKRTTGGLSTVTVVAGGTSTIDGASSFTLDAQYDCEVLFSSSTTGQWHRMRKAANLLAPDYLDFGDWIVGTDDSNPAPTATSDQYVAPDGTTTADKIEWDNSTGLADESWAEPGAASIEAGDTAQYSFYIDSEVGDGVKTVLEVGDSSVPQIIEQATVVFSNVLARAGTGQQLLTVDDGVENILASVGILDATGFDDLQTNVASQSVSSIAAPDGTLTAIETVATSSTVQPVVKALLFETTGTYTQIGDLWQNGLAWTCAIYAYMGQANAARITLQALTVTTAGVASDVVAVAVWGGSVVNFTSSSTGSVSYSAERNARVEAVGDTGWYRIELTLQDYAGTCDRIYLEIYGTSDSAYDRHITWNPTLRYGDWVARGKNWLPTTDIIGSWLQGNLDDIQLSSEAAPDGTLSAVDVYPTVGSIGTVSFNQLTSAYGWPDDARYTWEFYIKHPLPVSSPTCYFNCTVDSTGGDEQWWPIIAQDGGFTGGIARNVTSGPGYSIADDAEAVAIGTDGWWRYRFSMQQFDTAATIFQVQTSVALRVGATGQKITIWNPRLTVGNPADARGYFVSGPQNLLGDGSDYSGWTAGVH